MQATAGSSDTVSEKFILQLWIRRLPPIVQAVLKSNTNQDKNVLLQTADNIHEIYQRQNHSVFSASNPQPSISTDCDRFQRMENEISRT